MKQNVYNQPYNHHHHHQSNSTASSNNSNPPVNPPNYSSALKNNNNSNNNTNNSSGPRGGPTQQNKPQHTGYNNHRGSGGGSVNQANQNSHGPSMNYTGGYQQSGNTGANPAGGPAPPPGHFDNQQYNYSQQAQYGGGKQQGQQFNQQGYNKPSATSENGPYYNKAAQHKQIHVTPPPNLVQQQQQQQHSQPHPQQQAPPASVSEPTPALTKQTSIEEPSTVKVVTPASIVVASSTAEITEKMSSMKIESKQPQVVEGEKKIDEPMNESETSISPDIQQQQQQQQPTVIISQDQEFEPSRLCEVTGSCENGADNSEYYRNLVVAVDRLYPESKFPLHDTWTFGYIKNDPSAARWEMNIKEIIDISYVEDFWSVVSHCPTASQLFNLGDLTFFKKGIRPMWEDAENKQGGSWLHQVSGNAGGGSFANKRPSAMEVDDFWIETLLALIGDNFCANNHLVTGDSTTSSSDTHICGNISGLFLSHRGKGWKLALWTKNYRDEKTTRLIGKMWKHLLKLNDNHTITFEAHESKNNKNASNKIVYKE